MKTDHRVLAASNAALPGVLGLSFHPLLLQGIIKGCWLQTRASQKSVVRHQLKLGQTQWLSVQQIWQDAKLLRVPLVLTVSGHLSPWCPFPTVRSPSSQTHLYSVIHQSAVPRPERQDDRNSSMRQTCK